MFSSLSQQKEAFLDWSWPRIEPYYADLVERELDGDTVSDFLQDWTTLEELVWESLSRRRVANTQDTTEPEIERRYYEYLETVVPNAAIQRQLLTKKLLESGLEPAGFEIPLRNMRTDFEIFREQNLPLQTQEAKLGSQYNKIIGAQSVSWGDREVTLTQLRGALESADRAERARAWQAKAQRQLADREAINEIWVQMLANRGEQATNAGFDNYRSLRWQMLKRFEYTPADCETFHAAIEEVVVPLATQIYEEARVDQGTDDLRPWDVLADVYLISQPKLTPYADTEELERVAERIFQRVDGQLGDYFSTMRSERLLDLPNRKGKAPGGYCTAFPASQRPFIFMNAVGSSDDVRTLLHEAGHAFHVFEAGKLPYIHQRRTTQEFSEVASMAMELLSLPYLTRDEGGYFSTADAATFRRRHLRKILLFWPFMTVVDAFQHWVYTHPEAAVDPLQCDEQWGRLWDRFLPAVDWRGFEEVKRSGWQRKLHITRYPFYYVEYGLAQLGAIQVWRNALSDQQAAVERYRAALRLGGTRAIPDLFAAAGGHFGFDVPTLADAVGVLTSQM